MRNTALVNGYIRAIADTSNPLKTQLSLILTDFEPNGNKMGVPLDEKSNILNTALHMPVKINFDGIDYAGHDGAFAIGPIVSTYESKDNGRDIIAGDAIIWNELFDDVAQHVKVAFSEGIGTSWEIYYDNATLDDNGIQWLHGCVFAGTCIVKVPAYGPSRTRILAVAEAMSPKQNGEIMAKPEKAEDLSETRNDLMDIEGMLWQLYEGIDQLYARTFEIEAESIEKDISKIAVSFAEKLSKLADYINSLATANAELTTKLESATAEKDKLIAEKAQAEQEKERNDTLSTIRTKLKDVGMELDDDTFNTRAEMYLSMSEQTFDLYLNDMRVLNSKKANSEQKKTVIPEPLHTSDNVTTADVAAAIREKKY